MKLTLLNVIPWAAYSAALLFTAGMMIWYRTFRHWPCLFTFTLFETAVQATLFLCVHHYRWYFYAYWWSAVARAFLRLSVVHDIIRSIPAIQRAPAQLMGALVLIAATITAGSVFLAAGGSLHAIRLTTFVQDLDRCVAVLWAAFALAMFFSMRLLGVGWTRSGLHIAAGYLAGSVATLAGSYVVLVWPCLYHTVDSIQTALLATIWIFWGWSASIPPDQPRPLSLVESASIRQILSSTVSSCIE